MMSESFGMENPNVSINPEPAAVEDASAEYLGRWNRLVSTTNWEKGRIISEWRAQLVDAGASVQSYSDDAWSRRVGNVSSQHVGRLRRVYDRFGQEYDQYPGLYWSHFQSALDWNDAEMWLEGAAASGWSVSEMRAQRWQALGAPDELKPRDEDVITAELDEDATDEPPGGLPIAESMAEIRGLADDEAAEDEPPEAGPAMDASGGEALASTEQPEPPPPFRPFEDLPQLPDDLADATEAMKLAIVTHKLAGWSDISREHVLDVLDALKQLALSPSDG